MARLVEYLIGRVSSEGWMICWFWFKYTAMGDFISWAVLCLLAPNGSQSGLCNVTSLLYFHILAAVAMKLICSCLFVAVAAIINTRQWNCMQLSNYIHSVGHRQKEWA